LRPTPESAVMVSILAGLISCCLERHDKCDPL
jgi:hypothetical protein